MENPNPTENSPHSKHSDGQSFLDEFPAPERGQPQIFADNREREELLRALRAQGAVVRVRQLPVADFILSARLAAERKTRADFEASVMDGRLFDQARRLAENYERSVIIVEGKREEGEERLSRASTLGAYASLIADYGLALFFTADIDATAELLVALARHEQLAQKRPLRVYARAKALTVQSQQRAVIESLPGVGPTLAKALLARFGTIPNILTASEKELQEVNKLGPKKAKTIAKLLSTVYEDEEKM